MTRRSSIAVSAAIALASVALLVGLSGMLAADRSRDLERYDRAVQRQSREAGQAAPRPEDARPPPRETAYCVTGVDGFVTTLHNALGTSIVDDDGRLKPAELRRLSGLATRALRYVEQAHAGPALPQRLGRTRTVDDSGAPAWAALSPPTLECQGGEAIAAFRLDTSSGGQVPSSTAPESKSKSD